MPIKQVPLRLPMFTLAVAIALVAAFAPSAGAADSVSRQIALKVNALRAQHGLSQLKVDGRLERAARWQSGSMQARQSLSHGNPSGRARLTRLCTRMRAKTVGETIGWLRYRSPAAQASGIVRWWMNSPPHRAALMSPTFHRIGVGRHIGRFGRLKVVWFTADLSG